jgi:secreted trypsin-like serine protease
MHDSLRAPLLIHFVAAGVVFVDARGDGSPADGDPPVANVVGGSPSAPGAYPWMVALVDSREPDNLQALLCGGSLVHPRWVVTAASCLVDRLPTDVYVLSLDGEILDVNDNYLGSDSRVSFTAEVGRVYVVRASTALPEETGAYTLELTSP